MIKSLHCSFFNLHESAWCFVLWKVEDVDKKFEDLQKQREAGWVKKSPEPVKKVVKVSLSGKIGIWLEWNSFIFTFPEPVLHISHPHWCDFCSVLSLIPLYSDLNEMFY